MLLLDDTLRAVTYPEVLNNKYVVDLFHEGRTIRTVTCLTFLN